ncbi:hypothetical protein hamaS1_06160 [Moorella sp. Hama-1]|uniref:hypothetical protein n=1 Tax=Moorella sp. Hama-1 TaxID=2138101 RepID=UPI0020632841|nr:hypothetical protein [Moorella sp. Hama-1]BCV20547.1 hypothetical protein hamaS1_06160 [Moorella sp. Hama-1]
MAEHPRLTGSREWSMQLAHYLTTLKKKPGALAGSQALQQVDKKLQSIYHTYYSKREKEFIELLQYLQEDGSLSEVEKSIQELSQIHPEHVSTAKIKILCAKRKETLYVPAIASEETRAIADEARRHLKQYGELFQEVASA